MSGPFGVTVVLKSRLPVCQRADPYSQVLAQMVAELVGMCKEQAAVHQKQVEYL